MKRTSEELLTLAREIYKECGDPFEWTEYKDVNIKWIDYDEDCEFIEGDKYVVHVVLLDGQQVSVVEKEKGTGYVFHCVFVLTDEDEPE